MKRLTFEGNFCDIAMCSATPGGSFCEDGYCSQRKVWERLKEYEDREEQGCEWCDSLHKKNEDFKAGDMLARGVVEHTYVGDGIMHPQKPNYCPMCGRKLALNDAKI